MIAHSQYTETAPVTREDPARAEERRRALFEDRYGVGWYERLESQLRQPCVSFAEIAERFGVTRERVRQWQLELFPQSPRGHVRRRLCREHQQKRRVLADPLFRAFYRHARAHLRVDRVGLIAGAGGFRTRTVRILGQVVALRDASHAQADALPRFRGRADYVYFLLAGGEFAFVASQRAASRGEVMSRNTFEVFTRERARVG